MGGERYDGTVDGEEGMGNVEVEVSVGVWEYNILGEKCDDVERAQHAR